jgi:hypothetical protein
VSVVVNGVMRRTEVAENAYVLELPHASGLRFENVLLRLRDGTTDALAENTARR